MNRPRLLPLYTTVRGRRCKVRVHYGPAYQPLSQVPRPHPLVKVRNEIVAMTAMERDALANYRQREMDRWYQGLGILDWLESLPELEARRYRKRFEQAAGKTHAFYLHTMQVLRDTDTGEEFLVACRWPAQPQVVWSDDAE